MDENKRIYITKQIENLMHENGLTYDEKIEIYKYAITRTTNVKSAMELREYIYKQVPSID
jgi:hypothetical protein